MGLHQTRIDDPIICSGRAHAAVTLLHEDSKYKPSIDARRAGDGLDTAFYSIDLVIRVIRDTELSA
jgi:hypothetical protein